MTKVPRMRANHEKVSVALLGSALASVAMAFGLFIDGGLPGWAGWAGLDSPAAARPAACGG